MITDRNAQIEQLIRLNNDGFIDDGAFISAIKKVYEKAYPVGSKVTSPLGGAGIASPFSPSSAVGGMGHSISGTSYKSAESKLRASYDIDPHFGVPVDSVAGVPIVDGKLTTVSGLAKPDIYSGSILKPSDIHKNSVNAVVRGHPCRWCGLIVSNHAYHDCKKGTQTQKDFEVGQITEDIDTGKKFLWNGYRWIDCSPERESRLTDEDWEFAMTGSLKINSKPKQEVTVIAYSENRSHVPEHAKQMLEWIDEAWGKKVEEYNNSKPDWSRVVEKDEDGNELIEWRNKEVDDSLLQAYQNFITNDVVVEGDDADINGLQHIFNLDISKNEC